MWVGHSHATEYANGLGRPIPDGNPCIVDAAEAIRIHAPQIDAHTLHEGLRSAVVWRTGEYYRYVCYVNKLVTIGFKNGLPSRDYFQKTRESFALMRARYLQFFPEVNKGLEESPQFVKDFAGLSFNQQQDLLGKPRKEY